MLLAMTINMNEKKTTGRRKSVIQHEAQVSVRQRTGGASDRGGKDAGKRGEGIVNTAEE